ncbi:glycosyltransferase family 4 protein [Niveibacterium terrae]|uniref:glycosyltransferase family 4 protein n=1 Tax=Niveibacterium terrae TaxID=3373598 RepID=UPI003A9345EF
MEESSEKVHFKMLNRPFFDDRWIGTHGIGRFAKEAISVSGFVKAKLPGHSSSPFDPLLLTLWCALHGKSFLFSPGYNAPLFFHSRFCFVVHDLNHISYPGYASLLKRIYYRLVIRRACRRCRAVLTVSEYTKNLLVEWAEVSPNKIHVVGNGVADDFEPDGVKYSHIRPYFLCVSNRQKHKNEIGLLRAFRAYLNDQVGPDADLIFTGKVSADLEKEISSLGIADRVHFLGKFSDGELASLYRGAICLVFPSYFEGFGLPVLEAMACGTPVVASNRTSIPEIAGEAAMLVNPDSIGEMQMGMTRVAIDAVFRANLIECGIKRAKYFSWDLVREKIVCALNDAYALNGKS